MKSFELKVKKIMWDKLQNIKSVWNKVKKTFFKNPQSIRYNTLCTKMSLNYSFII
ncbi:hypothetical protein Hanom_Chr17g01540321 [Helianthus anomalus]